MVAYALFMSEEIISDAQPLGISEPVYISYLVDFQISDKTKYMTGAVIPVSAGNI